MAHYNKVNDTLKQAESGLNVTTDQQDTEMVRRETDRAARFIPEFKDPATREARKGAILEQLKRYGVTKEDMDEITDHKAWRLMDAHARVLEAQKKAPEVKKHLTETKAKIVNGRVSPARDPSNGQFLNKARERLRKEGTEDAFAEMLLSSGALKGF